MTMRLYEIQLRTTSELNRFYMWLTDDEADTVRRVALLSEQTNDTDGPTLHIQPVDTTKGA